MTAVLGIVDVKILIKKNLIPPFFFKVMSTIYANEINRLRANMSSKK